MDGKAKRRGNGEGTTPRWDPKTRRWMAKYTGADGVRRTVTSSVPGPAGARVCRELMADALTVTREGELPKPTRLTVKVQMESWTKTWIDPENAHKPATGKDYRACTRLHINPEIGDKALNGEGRLNGSDVQTMLNNMKCAPGSRTPGKAVSETMRQHVYDILHAALKRAVTDNKAKSNAADSVPRPGRNTKVFVPWTEAQTHDFLDSVEDDRFEALWTIYLMCGPRQGEGIGLRWTDIDFDAGEVRFAGQLNRKTHLWELRKGSKLRPGAPVLMPMPDRVMDLLLERRSIQKREQVKAGPKWTGNAQDLVFTSRYGTPLCHNNIGDAWRLRVSRVEGLPATKPHGARHFAASYQYAGGADDKRVAAFLGQADNGETARKVYIHLPPTAAADAVARANAMRPRKVAG